MDDRLRVTSEDALTDVAFKVCSALAAVGIEAVLCGGSAAEVYVPQEYQSGDVDFAVSWLFANDRMDTALAGIGYSKQGRIYVSGENPVTVDFPADTVMIWDEPITGFDTMTRDGLALNITTPFDTVRDRLCWFFWDIPDYQAMKVAVAIARNCDIDLTALGSWAERIGEAARYQEFQAALKSSE